MTIKGSLYNFDKIIGFFYFSSKMNIRLYHRMKFMKLDTFTIFLVLLGILVIITLFINWKDSYYSTESFVNFQNHPGDTGSMIYIPQYTTNANRKVLSLYDNIYFDTINGSLIEVFAPSCSANCDTTGKMITDITVASRDGMEITAIPSVLDSQGIPKAYSSPQSLLDTTTQLYNQYLYTSSCKNTNIYQVFYVSWYNNTYINMVDLSKNSASGTMVQSFLLNSSGIVSSQKTFTTQNLQPYSTIPLNMTISNSTSLPSTPDTNYLKGAIGLFQLGKDANNHIVSYDISNGNIIVNNAGNYTVYNRNGSTVQNVEPNMPWQSLSSINTFIINDITGLSILVTGYQNDTVIQLVGASSKSYQLLYSYRFNQYGYVNSIQNDTDHNPSLATTPVSTMSSGSSSGSCPLTTTFPSGMSKCDLAKSNDLSNLNGQPSNTSNVCGDDLSCKWYWYFNTISQKNKNGSDYFSDDYFLKTEAVPPVCPQCPQCSNNGPCTNCGGNGGCGTVITTTPTLPIGAITDGNLPPGAIKDASGNVYISYTDPSGNTKYVLYSNYSARATAINNYNESNNNSNNDSDSNKIGDLANNIVDTTGNTVNNVIDSAEGAVGSVADAAGGAVNSVTDLAGGIAGGVFGTANHIIGRTGNALGSIGNNVNGQNYGNQYGNGVNGSTVSSLGYMNYSGNRLNQPVNYTPGYTPIDNYSHYGALQSKGGNYMPVTADFSSFRK